MEPDLVEMSEYINHTVTTSRQASIFDRASTTSEQASFSKVMRRNHVIIAMLGCFCAYYQQSMIEAIAMPITIRLFSWDQIHVAIMFIVTSVIGILTFVSTMKTVKLGGVRGNLLFGLVGSVINVYGILAYSVLADKGLPWTMPVFLFGVAVYVICMVYVVTATASLITIGVPEHLQARLQGIRTGAMQIAYIVGPSLTTYMLAALNVYKNTLTGGLEWGYTLIWTIPAVFMTSLLIFTLFKWKTLSRETLYTCASYTPASHAYKDSEKLSKRADTAIIE